MTKKFLPFATMLLSFFWISISVSGPIEKEPKFTYIQLDDDFPLIIPVKNTYGFAGKLSVEDLQEIDTCGVDLCTENATLLGAFFFEKKSINTSLLVVAYYNKSGKLIGIERKVIIVTPDTIAPVISMIGGDVSLTVGEEYIEQGATALDNVDGVVEVKITGNVDTQTVGTYKLTYKAIDQVGNIATEERQIIITEKEALKSGVLATGETRSFAANDDGSSQRGIARSYKEKGEVILDNVTKLIWQNDIIPDLLIWKEAVSYCEGLSLAGADDWRLPRIEELLTLVDLTKTATDKKTTIAYRYTQKFSPVFSINKTHDIAEFWTITDFPAAPNKYAYFVDFSRGHNTYFSARRFFSKASKRNIRCVRGENQYAQSHFVRDEQSNTVTDVTTGLMWQDDAETIKPKNWKNALLYCEGLTMAGFSDWKLPNINELSTTTDYLRFDPALNKAFKHYMSFGDADKDFHNGNYWSSTYYGVLGNNYFSRTLNTQNGGNHRCITALKEPVRCVRAIGNRQ